MLDGDRQPAPARAFPRSVCGADSWTLMSGSTVLGIVLIALSAVTLAIVAVMFVWGAREGGREQRRINARLSRGPRNH